MMLRMELYQGYVQRFRTGKDNVQSKDSYFQQRWRMKTYAAPLGSGQLIFTNQ